MLVSKYVKHSRVTVGLETNIILVGSGADHQIMNAYLARVVDESGCVALHGRINDQVVVDAEHVAADAF